MRIIELKAENFKRLQAVEIKPGEGLVQITGRNEQGKSSILDAVFAAFGGGNALPERPIRKGAAKAEVFVDVGEVRVTRRFTEKGTTLLVENKDGLRYTTPQAILDELVGKLTFDPMDFMRMKEKEQASLLRQLAGIDTASLDLNRQTLFAQRTEANKRAKHAATLAEAMPKYDGAPTEVVSIAALAKKLREAREHNAACQKKTDEHLRLDAIRDRAATAVEDLEKKLADAKVHLKRCDDAMKVAAEATEGLTLIDLVAIESEMETAEGINAEVAANAKRADAIAAAKKLSEEAAKLSRSIEAIDANKAAMLADAKMPIDGLAVDGDVVTFDGIPLSQASSAEKIRISLAISAALNPKLRVVMIRDGSLLDDESLAEVATWAEANDMQVLCERVASSDEAVGIVIEDGQVVQHREMLTAS